MEWGLVTEVTAAGPLVRLASEESARRKPMPAPKGAAPAAGDRVLVHKAGGRYVVLAVYAGAADEE